MKRFFILFLILSLLVSQVAFAFEETNGKIIFSKQEFLKLDEYITKLEKENELLKEKVKTLEEALDKYKDYSLEIETNLKKELDNTRKQFELTQEQLQLYEYEIMAKEREIRNEKAQKILFGILGIGFGYLISQIQR